MKVVEIPLNEWFKLTNNIETISTKLTDLEVKENESLVNQETILQKQQYILEAQQIIQRSQEVLFKNQEKIHGMLERIIMNQLVPSNVSPKFQEENPLKDYLTLQECATMLGVSYAAISYNVRVGNLKTSKVDGSSKKYVKRSDFKAYAAIKKS